MAVMGARARSCKADPFTGQAYIDYFSFDFSTFKQMQRLLYSPAHTAGEDSPAVCRLRVPAGEKTGSTRVPNQGTPSPHNQLGV